MARIPEADIERLKEEISVQRLVEDSGIALKKSGKDWLGCCPFHEDDTASLVVTPAKNLWHCFGCQIGGGPIDWVMKAKGVSFRHAVELLKADPSLAARPAVEGSSPVKRSTVRALPPPVALDADDQHLLDDTLAYYHARLKQSPEALAYLEARGLTHPELVDTFKLGLADRTLGLRLPEKNRKAGADIRTRLQTIGLLRESGHEHFNGSLVIPVFNDAGHVTEVYGRKLRDDLRPGTPKHLYLPGPHAGIFNEAALAASKEIILCEALIDALTFWCAGFTNVTAAYGVEGFTDDHRAAFKRYGTERVLIAYDRDDAGDRAAEKLAERLIAEGIECLRVRFPKGMDANSYALKLTPATHSLGLVLRQADWLGRGERPTPSLPPVVADLLPLPAPLPPTLPTPSPLAADGLAVLPEGDELPLTFGERQWRVRGWRKNTAPESMRVNLHVRREGEPPAFHVDTLDLYAARARAAYLKQASVELGLPEDTLKRDLGQVLLTVETAQDALLRRAQEPKRQTPVLSPDEEADALALLRSPDLIGQIVRDLASCGVVGEATNLLAGYLATVSRKLDTPLAILIQSSSAAGKSALMDAVLAMVPEEERVQYSAMTGQSLFYLGETNLQHKILAIAEEEGVRQAAYALKLLQSEGELTMASTGKDEATGNLTTRQYRVKGPVMLMLTTTAIDVDEELMNRCLVLTVNESREQTRAIHARQRQKQTLAGLLATSDKEALTALHQNAQRLLSPVRVVNPFADRLTFLDDKTRTRRDHVKYLTLIRAIALLHQHQREIKTVDHRGQRLAYIEVTKDDIALANRIAHEVLGRTLDELPPQTRRLLTLMHDMVQNLAKQHGMAARDVRFTRRDVRDATQWSDNQLKVHCARLTDMEYLLIHGGGRGHHLRYELLYDAAEQVLLGDAPNEGRHLCGLIDVAELDQINGYDRRKLEAEARKLGPGLGQVGPKLGPGWDEQNLASQGESADLLKFRPPPHVHTPRAPAVVAA